MLLLDICGINMHFVIFISLTAHQSVTTSRSHGPHIIHVFYVSVGSCSKPLLFLFDLEKRIKKFKIHGSKLILCELNKGLIPSLNIFQHLTKIHFISNQLNLFEHKPIIFL